LKNKAQILIKNKKMKKTTLILTAAFMVLSALAQKSNNDVSAKKVIADYIKAIGGEDELKKIKTIWWTSERDLIATGKATIAREGRTDTNVNVSGKVGKLRIEIKEMTPNKLLKTGVSESPNHPYNVKMVFDGADGSFMNNGIQSSIPEVQLARLKWATQIFIQTQYLSDLRVRLENKGIEKLNGKDCYKIQINFPDGGGNRVEFYDIDSKLLARRVDSSVNPIEILDYTDYRVVDHVLFSYKFLISNGDGNPAQEQKVTSIQLNKGVSESDFASGKKK
jgi:zinc protease